MSAQVFTGQSFQEQYRRFREETAQEYNSFRCQCNDEYAGFLRQAWTSFEGKAPVPRPREENRIGPKPFDFKDNNHDDSDIPVIVAADTVPRNNIGPQPKPFEPIRETPANNLEPITFDFYDTPCTIRISDITLPQLTATDNNAVANVWELLGHDGLNNTIRDCLETRIRLGLCDWAYLQLLDRFSQMVSTDSDIATLLMAYLYSQSGYQMRLAHDGKQLVMLFASRHQIFDKSSYVIEGETYYPYGDTSGTLSACKAAFHGESPLSLLITGEQKFGGAMSDPRVIHSEHYPSVEATAQVPASLIHFFDSYPTSAIGGNPLTKWAMYADTPLASATRDKLYPALLQSIAGMNPLEGANRLLDWVQTGFLYGYDDEVWGHDRAFFAEETLFYPSCDCEDRSILFSRLVRDLLDLDVALIYYPGHLATAVCFGNGVNQPEGDAIMIGNRRFVICDPTYIGAPVGAQMPGLDYASTQAILLAR